jgi:hypothetical protein
MHIPCTLFQHHMLPPLPCIQHSLPVPVTGHASALKSNWRSYTTRRRPVDEDGHDAHLSRTNNVQAPCNISPDHGRCPLWRSSSMYSPLAPLLSNPERSQLHVADVEADLSSSGCGVEFVLYRAAPWRRQWHMSSSSSPPIRKDRAKTQLGWSLASL